jgi:hypothetical protein
MNHSSNKTRASLWQSVAGSRSKRKRHVNALIRLGYTGPASDVSDQIRRDFQVMCLMRKNRCRGRHNQLPASNFLPPYGDESREYIASHS